MVYHGLPFLINSMVDLSMATYVTNNQMANSSQVHPGTSQHRPQGPPQGLRTGHVCQAVPLLRQHRAGVRQLVGGFAHGAQGAAQVVQQGPGLLHALGGIFRDVPELRMVGSWGK